jgi:transcriptional regulator with XRE-family HTH domain
MDSVKTGELIKEIRTERGLKQKDLAEKVFVSAAAVSKWENGHGFPDVSVLPDLCEVLDLSIEELMKGERNTMEDDKNDVVSDVVKIAGIQQRKHKKIIQILSILLLLAVIAGLLHGFSTYLHEKTVYIPYKGGTFDELNMYIQNNADVPTLFYKGKEFGNIQDFLITVNDADQNEYLIIAIESNAWNEYFGDDEWKQYSFTSFNDYSSSRRGKKFDPQSFKGVYLYEGDLYEFVFQCHNFTKRQTAMLLNRCTYVPYSQELR